MAHKIDHSQYGPENMSVKITINVFLLSINHALDKYTYVYTYNVSSRMWQLILLSSVVYQFSTNMLDSAWETQCWATVNQALVTGGMKCIEIFTINFNHSFSAYTCLWVYEISEGVWHMAGNNQMAQPWIFLTKSQECMVNCAIT